MNLGFFRSQSSPVVHAWGSSINVKKYLNASTVKHSAEAAMAFKLREEVFGYGPGLPLKSSIIMKYQ